MNSFDELVKIADRLLGPDGCEWDKKQTFATLQKYLIEEAHEAVEAIDSSDFSHLKEELGDVLYTLIFIVKLAEKSSLFTLDEVLEQISEKLIRRHPHIFSDVKVKDADEIEKNWKEIKQKEKKKEKKELEDYPPSLPILMKVQKIIKHIPSCEILDFIPQNEEEKAGLEMIKLILKSNKNQINVEDALRRTVKSIQKNAGDYPIT